MPKKISVAMLLIVTFTVLLFDTKCSAADMKGSVNSQLKLFVNNQDSWFVDEEEAEPGDYYFYAVTDMNKDNRLELIQLIYLANIDRTRCRFFEVDETYDGIHEMVYDAYGCVSKDGTRSYYPNMYTGGTEEMSLTKMYYKKDTKPDSDKVYYYVYSDRITEYEKYTEYNVKMYLAVDCLGHAWTDIMGYCDYDVEEDVYTYSDAQTVECRKSDYENVENLYFQKDDGYVSEPAAFRFVEQTKDRSLYDMLKYSYKGWVDGEL